MLLMKNKPRRLGSQSRSRQRRRRLEPRLAQLERRTMLSVAAPPGVSTPSVLYNAITTAAPYGPSQVYQGYGFNRVIFQSGSNYYLGNGAGQTIALVDAFNDASIASNLATFDSQLGLPAPPHFMVLNQTGGTSLSGVTSASSSRSATYGWSIEESLDVEWAHTIAPDANIVLFEANTNSNANLYAAVETAAKASTYTQYGLPAAGVVSDSWGGGESATETASDPDFTSSGNTVTFVFSSGDSHPVEYPSTSPNVLAVGGTRLYLTTSGFGTNYNGEGWYDTSVSNGGGGGASAYESEPTFQLGVQSSTKRETPDVSMNADGNSDVLVYDTNYPFSGYYGVYGTSEAAPMWAATLSIVDQGLTLAKGSFTTLGNAQAYAYQMPGVTGGSTPSSGSAYHDITGTFTYLSKSGRTTITTTYTATPGYDTLTGLGSPIPTAFIPDMISYALANGANPGSEYAGPGGGAGNSKNYGNYGTGSGGSGAGGSGSSAPGGGYYGNMAQPSGNFVGGGQLTVVMTPVQTPLAALPIAGAASPVAAVPTSVQPGVVSAPSAPGSSGANAFIPAGLPVGQQIGATARAQGLTAPDTLVSDVLVTDRLPSDGLSPDGHAPGDEVQPTRGDALTPHTGESSSGSSISPDRVAAESAVDVVLANDTLPVLLVEPLPGPSVQHSPADQQARPFAVSPAMDQVPTAGLALMLGHAWGVYASRSTRRKRPSLRPRN
jgi:hypothetical protein